LKQARESLHKLRSLPPASSDIAAKVDVYVSNLERLAGPMVNGYAQNQHLDVRWPTGFDSNRQNGVGFASERGNALLMMAAMFPDELSAVIKRAVTQAQPLSQAEHAERVDQLTSRITDLSYVEAALIERNGGEHSVEASPWCVLGVRIAVEEDAAA
jgi:hypothetical protein